MDSFAMMAVLIGVLALVLLGYFAVMWNKDKDRSKEESRDAERLEADDPGTRPPGGGTDT
jgi:flagellar basal body-associated protein FliL